MYIPPDYGPPLTQDVQYGTDERIDGSMGWGREEDLN
jgi:hypothetical protein